LSAGSIRTLALCRDCVWALTVIARRLLVAVGVACGRETRRLSVALPRHASRTLVGPSPLVFTMLSLVARRVMECLTLSAGAQPGSS
jgi:hypothetical protein